MSSAGQREKIESKTAALRAVPQAGLRAQQPWRNVPDGIRPAASKNKAWASGMGNWHPTQRLRAGP